MSLLLPVVIGWWWRSLEYGWGGGHLRTAGGHRIEASGLGGRWSVEVVAVLGGSSPRGVAALLLLLDVSGRDRKLDVIGFGSSSVLHHRMVWQFSFCLEQQRALTFPIIR